MAGKFIKSSEASSVQRFPLIPVGRIVGSVVEGCGHDIRVQPGQGDVDGVGRIANVI